MDSLSCKNEEIVKKERIHCTSCQKDYAIYAIKHTCNVLVPCGEHVGIKTEERYLATVDLANNVFAECEKCETKRIRLTQARKCTCPKCEYSGWYIHDESKLCPGCVSTVEPLVKPKPKNCRSFGNCH